MPNDDEVWKLYAKSVKKIRKAKAAPSIKTKTSFPRKRESIVARLRDEKTHTLAIARRWIPAFAGMTQKEKTTPTTLDRRIERNLKQGDFELHARIDLHGMTQAEAHEALANFMAAQVKAGRRNLLIITGKGRGNAGVLKTNLPLWLQALPEAGQILALRPAAPKHGGDGAVYLLLKKGSRFRSEG